MLLVVSLHGNANTPLYSVVPLSRILQGVSWIVSQQSPVSETLVLNYERLLGYPLFDWLPLLHVPRSTPLVFAWLQNTTSREKSGPLPVWYGGSRYLLELE